MNARILRVLGTRAKRPGVLALVDDHRVRWDPRHGWSCTCPAADDAECQHVDLIADLLDPRVIGDSP